MMEPLAPESKTHSMRKEKSSWGDVIAILLILAILAFGAYHVFTDRLGALPDAQATTMR